MKKEGAIGSPLSLYLDIGLSVVADIPVQMRLKHLLLIYAVCIDVLLHGARYLVTNGLPRSNTHLDGMAGDF